LHAKQAFGIFLRSKKCEASKPKAVKQSKKTKQGMQPYAEGGDAFIAFFACRHTFYCFIASGILSPPERCEAFVLPPSLLAIASGEMRSFCFFATYLVFRRIFRRIFRLRLNTKY
jgi:hypothetical protein